MFGGIEMEIPVYVITGFLESGKTSFMQETLQDPGFSSENEKTLLLACEEGMEEYEESILKKFHTVLVPVEEQEDFTTEFLTSCGQQYCPDRVMIEYNGVWQLQKLLEMELPKDWVIVQIITLVNAETFDMYLSNMRSIIMEHFSGTDMVIFNRCTIETPRAAYRRNVRAINGRAQVYFEAADEDVEFPEEELPFDVESSHIILEDEDFGIWYIDAMDEPQKYIGKQITFKGMVFKPEKMRKGSFVPGRFAMTCCADDTTFIGFICKAKAGLEEQVDSLKNRQFVQVTATVAYEFQKDYRGKGPVLYLDGLKSAEKPREEFVYFM